MVHLPNADVIPTDINKDGLKTLPDVLKYCVDRFPSRPAYTSLGRTIDFTELDKLSAAFAAYLQNETDLSPGDRVAVQLPNIVQYPVVLYGILRAGMVAVNTNPLYTPSEMLHQFKDSGAKALIIHKSMAHKAEEIIKKTDIKSVVVTQVGDLHNIVKRTVINSVVKYVKKMEPGYNLPGSVSLRSALGKYAGKAANKVEVAPGDVAVLQYTGGTTGVSKGAVLTHANIVANILQCKERLDLPNINWAETVISPLPLYHIYAFTVSQLVSMLGGHSVLIPNPRDIPGFVKEMSRWKMTTFVGLNTLFVALCNDEKFKELDFSNLRFTASGGMALFPSTATVWKQVTGCEIVEGYGLTETSPAISFNFPNKTRLGTIGAKLTHTDIRIIDSEGKDVGEGLSGELCVKGPQVMRGYWQREAETKKSFTEDGYFLTGDIVKQDPDGYLRIVDRAKDMIVVSGFNVFPNEVEDVISTHPEVIESAVIGLTSKKNGEMVKAFVVTKNENLTSEDIQQWCSDKLTRYKVPKLVEFVPELPKSNVGKVLRRKLRDNQENTNAA